MKKKEVILGLLVSPKRFLGEEYSLDDYDQIQDVVEVWFDSGSTHAFV